MPPTMPAGASKAPRTQGSLIEHANENRIAVKTVSRSRSAVFMATDECWTWQGTAHLLRSTNSASRLIDAGERELSGDERAWPGDVNLDSGPVWPELGVGEHCLSHRLDGRRAHPDRPAHPNRSPGTLSWEPCRA